MQKKLFRSSYFFIVVAFLCSAQAYSATLYQFVYTFESGAQVSGTFYGLETPSSPQGDRPFDGTITILGDDVVAIFNDFSGTTFSWDTRLPEDSSSQASLIGGGESAFASFDGSKMDFVLSSGYSNPVQIFLENGIQSGSGGVGTLNNASSHNLLATEFIESFQPSSWSLTVVPEPSLIGLLIVSAFGFGSMRCRK